MISLEILSIIIICTEKNIIIKLADEYSLFFESSAIESRYRCSESFVKKYNLPNGTYLCLFYFNYHLFGGDSGSPEFEIYEFNLGRCVNCDFAA